MNAIDVIMKAESLPDTPAVRDLIDQGVAWLEVGERIGYDVSINAARRVAGMFCYTCNDSGEVPGPSGRPDETNPCPDCGPADTEIPY